MAHLTRFRIGLLAALALIVAAGAYFVTRPALLNKKTIRTIVTQNLRHRGLDTSPAQNSKFAG